MHFVHSPSLGVDAYKCVSSNAKHLLGKIFKSFEGKTSRYGYLLNFSLSLFLCMRAHLINRPCHYPMPKCYGVSMQPGSICPYFDNSQGVIWPENCGAGSMVQFI